MELILCISAVVKDCEFYESLTLLTNPTLKRVHTESLDSNKLFSDGTYFQSVIPCLEFSMEFQSNKLIYQKEYTKRQQIIYLLIHHLHDREGWGYQKISNWLNKSSILTHTRKKWFSSSVISVLKRKHERDLMNQQIRNQYFPSKVSRFEVNYYIFDWIE